MPLRKAAHRGKMVSEVLNYLRDKELLFMGDLQSKTVLFCIAMMTLYFYAST